MNAAFPDWWLYTSISVAGAGVLVAFLRGFIARSQEKTTKHRGLETAGARPGKHDAEIRPCRRPRARGRGREGRTGDRPDVRLPGRLNRKPHHDGLPAII